MDSSDPVAIELVRAIHTGDTSTLGRLVEEHPGRASEPIRDGADMEMRGGSIGTPLDNAIGYGCWHVARLLAASGARVDKLWHAAALGILPPPREPDHLAPRSRRENGRAAELTPPGHQAHAAHDPAPGTPAAAA